MLRKCCAHITSILVIALFFSLCNEASMALASDSLHTKIRVRGSVNEYAPVVYPLLSFDGRTLYFSRKYHPENKGKTRDADDIWSCTKTQSGDWSEAVPETKLNTSTSDVLCSLSPDGSTALLARTDIVDNTPRVQLFVVNRTQTGWDTAKLVHIDNFSGRTSHIYAHLTFDSTALFLSLDTVGRGMDVFVCTRKQTSDSSWQFTAPMPLGNVINTKGTEGSPFLAYDGKTLYFTSDGHGSSGSQDVFVSRRLDSSWTSWSTPLNLGDSINTTLIDHCFSLSSDGTKALIVSADTSGVPGVFQIDVPTALRMGESVVGKGFGTRGLDTLVITVTFPTNKTKIRERNLDSIILANETKLRRSKLSVAISGHTDLTGIEARNSTLSLRRALALRQTLRRALCKLLRTKKLPSILCVGRGTAESIGDNNSEAGRQANRRATARIIIQKR